jgi:hypothetical protein
MTENLDIDQWLAVRKAEGKKIDPRTAEVMWAYAWVCDPYGVLDEIPEELKCAGRAYFARNPESDIWVCFDDLPKETYDVLWEAHKHKLAFPAGLKLADRSGTIV